MSSFSHWLAFEKKVHKIQKWFGYRYIVNSHGLAWAKWTPTIVAFHKRGQSLTVLLFFFCFFCVWIELSHFNSGHKRKLYGNIESRLESVRMFDKFHLTFNFTSKSVAWHFLETNLNVNWHLHFLLNCHLNVTWPSSPYRLIRGFFSSRIMLHVKFYNMHVNRHAFFFVVVVQIFACQM